MPGNRRGAKRDESKKKSSPVPTPSGKLAPHYDAILRESGALSQETDFLDLKNTPARMSRMMVEELLSSYQPGAIDKLKQSFTTFPAPSGKKSAMIVETNIPYHSLCAHHGIPFFGTVSVGYIPNKSIVGLSKIPRTVKFFSSKFQVQERLVDEIADFLVEMLEPLAVIVLMKGVHLCMAMRGVAVAGVETKTTALRGTAFSDSRVSDEFYRLISL
jgi:GTP cyclohydrolase IA